MRRFSLFRVALLAMFVCLWHVSSYLETGHAETALAPQQLQGLIASGQEKAALTELKNVLRAHPHSGVAWYLVAEAQDASNDRAAARGALAKAEQYAPGLPFAQPDKVAALKAHLARPAARTGSGVSPAIIVIGALVILFVLIRLFLRSRRSMPPTGYPNSYGSGFPGGPPGSPYGPNGGMPYGPGAGMPRSGAGSSLLSGLAAGAGFAAGERVIDGLTGARGERLNDPASDNNPMPAPDRDDGLMGSSDWGNDNAGSGGSDTPDNGGFDPDDQW